jgi:hypothetical protein
MARKKLSTLKRTLNRVRLTVRSKSVNEGATNQRSEFVFYNAITSTPLFTVNVADLFDPDGNYFDEDC